MVQAPAEPPPPSPSHGVWLTEPPSIDEPLLLLDEEQERIASAVQLAAFRGEWAEERSTTAAELAALRADLAEARAACKADHAALEALTTTSEALETEMQRMKGERTRLCQENGVLRLQLQDHHGIMAADWAQTLGFQERLRHEEAACTQLSGEVAELREGLAATNEEAAMLREDANRWRVLRSADHLSEVSARELDEVLQVTLPALPRLHAEACNRSRAAKQQLHSELEHQLCVVCRDAKKAVLFQPCLHICVCERCRGRLRPYRCPMCQEPVQSHIGRVHF